MTEYYTHSTGEIFLLLFIFSLWFTSVYFWFKRYKKITTIERADMPRYEKQCDMDASKSTTHASNSSLNLKTRANNPSSDNLQFNSSFNNNNNYTPNLANSKMSNYSMCTTLNTSNIRQLNHSPSRLSQLRAAASLDKTSSRTSLYKHNHQHNAIYYLKNETCQQSNSRLKTLRPRLIKNLRKTNVISYSNFDVSNLLFNSVRSANPSRATLTKTVSEPLIDCTNLNDLSNEVGQAKIDANTLVESSNEYFIEVPRMVSPSKIKTVPKRDSDLLNPNMIPALVRRSLMDLHKKSMTNVSGVYKTSAGAVSCGSNKRHNVSSSNNSKSNVFTQQRRSDEMRINVNRNYQV